MFGIHPDLRRHVLLVFVSSAALGALGLVVLAALLTNAAAVRAIPALVVIAFGVVAVGVAYLGTIVAPLWYRKASRVVSSVQPVPGTAVLRLDSSSDSTSLYARLEPSRELALLMPGWEMDSLLGLPVSVSLYIDPATLRVVALKTDRGLLWSTPQHLERS